VGETVNRSTNTSKFPLIKGDISFSVIEKGEFSNVCKSKSEAYVIDDEVEWKNIAGKKLMKDCNGNGRKTLYLISILIIIPFWPIF
jgi:hypothetical protein